MTTRFNVNELEPEDCYIYFRKGNRDHIYAKGDTICSNDVRVPESEGSDDLRPVLEIPGDRWGYLEKSLCMYCRSIASRCDFLPDIPDPADYPTFSCPVCGEETTRVNLLYNTVGIVEHEDGERHEFDFELFERWRRGDDVEPEE